jgi:hypothetical protein
MSTNNNKKRTAQQASIESFVSGSSNKRIKIDADAK